MQKEWLKNVNSHYDKYSQYLRKDKIHSQCLNAPCCRFYVEWWGLKIFPSEISEQIRQLSLPLLPDLLGPIICPSAKEDRGCCSYWRHIWPYTKPKKIVMSISDFTVTKYMVNMRKSTVFWSVRKRRRKKSNKNVKNLALKTSTHELV